MATKLKVLAGVLALAGASLLPSLATAQPLGVTVNPAFSSARIGVAPDGRPIIPVRRLLRIGPYFVNPPNADYRRPIVLRRGSIVPEVVPTSDVQNLNVPGLVRGANYEYFISMRKRVVLLEPTTRQVVRIVR